MSKNVKKVLAAAERDLCRGSLGLGVKIANSDICQVCFAVWIQPIDAGNVNDCLTPSSRRSVKVKTQIREVFGIPIDQYKTRDSVLIHR